MKILLDALQAGNDSGTGRYTEELLKGLPLIDETVEVRPFVPEGVDVSSLGCTEDSVIRVDTGSALAGSRYRNKKIRKDLKSFKPDIVHYTATIGSQAKAKKWDKSKVILTVHDLGFLREPKWFKKSREVYYKKMIRKSVDYADRIIADSCATADDLMILLEIPESKIDVVPLGVNEQYKQADEDAMSAVRAKYKLPDRFFLYVGTIEPRKNIVRIVEAYSEIASSMELDLVIAGRDGWKVKPIYKAIRKSPVRERIHLPGFVSQEDLPALYSSADVFVWPSLWEGFGLPPLEAMACGTPVVTSNVSSMPEVLEQAAMFADPFSVEKIGELMQRLVTDVKHYKGLRSSGLNRAARYPWRITADMTLDVYRRALDGQT
ncbi:MAG: glycosyltransferase family 1 protein [Candidatus Hydrogenedentota bacterium]